MKKLIYLFSAALILSTTAKAQQVCGTDEMNRKLKEQYPEIAKYEKILQEQISEQSKHLNLGNAGWKTTAFGENDTLHIPVVVHVVHDYGNINYVSDNKIYQLMEFVNNSFSAKNTAELNNVIPTFKPYIGNAKIQFHLATKDPQGNPTKGITHRWSYLTYGGDNQAKYDLWAPDSYINIWLIEYIGSSANVLAYALKPAGGAGAPWYDGVIGQANASTSGGSNNYYTIPHELGHVLNLDHTWGGTNEPDVACGDDDVEDTPPTEGGFHCNLADTACNNNYVPTSKILIDSTNLIADSINGRSVTIVAKTGISLTSLDIYPLRIGEGFDIALVRGTDTLEKFAQYERVGDTTADAAVKTDNYNTKQRAGISFNVNNNARIETVTIFPNATGQSFEIMLTNGNDTLATYSGTTSTSSGPQVVPVGFFVPKKTNYWIYLTQNPGLKHDAPTSFPATAPMSGITLNYHTDTVTGSNKGYYNFLYDWSIRYRGISDTDKTVAKGSTKPHTVGLNWNMPPSTTPYRIILTENQGMSHDSVPTVTYNNSIQCVADITNERTNGTYNYLYNLVIRYGYIRGIGNNCVDYPDTANTQNIMNYTQTCKSMFTKGQVERMRKTLASPVANRDNLVSEQNALKTGILNPKTGKYGEGIDLKPNPDYSVEKGLSGERTYFLCADNNREFKFRDRSWGDTVESVKWEFTNGANPATSSSNNVEVKFSQPGWVTIKLTATGNNTGDSTIERSNVYAADPNYTVNALGYFQEFDGGTNDLDKWPTFNYYDNYTKWEISENVGFYDNTSMVFKGFDDRGANAGVGSPRGDQDDFFTPAYNLSNLSGDASFNFMYAGAYRTTEPTYMRDSLEIHYSTDCGASWQLLKRFVNQELATKGTVHGRFAPLWQGDWAQKSIDIPAGAKADKVFFRFRYLPGVGADFLVSGTGNNFFIDRININEFPSGVSTLLPDNKNVVLAPNPTTKGSYVVIRNNNGANSEATVMVTDITGKVVYTVQQTLKNQIERIEIPANAVPTKGIYMVQVRAGESTYTEKLVVY